MEAAANREIGLIIQELLASKYHGAGLEPPAATVGTLGAALYALGTKINEYWRANNVPSGLEETTDNDPTIVFYQLILKGMIWTSLLPPHRLDEGAQVVAFADEKFFTFGYPQLEQSAKVQLIERVRELMHRPTPPGELGALGAAHFYISTVPFADLHPDRSAAARRRRYKNEVRALCAQIEATTGLADRKVLGGLIGEKLAAELRRSKCQNASWRMSLFWATIDLFFVRSPFAG